MITKLRSRRTFLGLLTVSVSSFSLLTACGDSKAKIKEAAIKLASLIRYHPVAAHLGRLNDESNSNLQPLSTKALVNEIANDIGIDIRQVLDTDVVVIKQLVDNKVRQDFLDENVVAIDGWLLSQTEAKICTLAFRNIQQTSS